jgi:hypothetical protein
MIPYGNPYTQYAVMLCGDSDSTCTQTNNDDSCDPNEICFAVQSHVSSTGRAGDSFSRIETSFELMDSMLLLPQDALNISGSIDKNFYVTENNWGGENYGVAGNLSEE